MGARLAALQAQSGGFAVIPVDKDDSDVGDHTDGRGMWDAKVPPAPAEPDEEPAPYQEYQAKTDRIIPVFVAEPVE